jgi:hypothetical protein
MFRRVPGAAVAIAEDADVQGSPTEPSEVTETAA